MIIRTMIPSRTTRKCMSSLRVHESPRIPSDSVEYRERRISHPSRRRLAEMGVRLESVKLVARGLRKRSNERERELEMKGIINTFVSRSRDDSEQLVPSAHMIGGGKNAGDNS